MLPKSTLAAMSSSTNDFKNAFDNLDTAWVMFRKCFTIAVKAKCVWDHFDGSMLLPVIAPAVAAIPATMTAPAVPAVAAVTEAEVHTW